MNGSDKPRTFSGDLAHLPAALLPLTEEQRWVVWPWELAREEERRREVDQAATSGARPEGARRKLQRSRHVGTPTTTRSRRSPPASADGIGFMLKDSSVGAVDLDHCVERDTGELRRLGRSS